MDERRAFLLSMLDDSGDANRLVFADWLDERGESDFARRLRQARQPVEIAWAIIHDWLARNHPAMLKLLHSPKKKPGFARLEARIGQRLPESFKVFYGIHDGSEEVSGVLIGLSLFPLARIREVWQQWADYADDEELVDDLSEDLTSQPPGAVKPLYANRGWVPFAGDSQNHFALDFDPGPSGTIGQVINCGRDDEVRHAVAPTFEGFLAFAAKQYVLDRVTLAEGEDPADPKWLMLAKNKRDFLTGLADLLRLERKRG
jgi:uncharacterized protein (TIGR02996 family)